ncbi:MAG: hypothetical protein EA378_06065 [Phycisphaerales bacterium]|nr:MAG: hypothetical protein EA378_06065 [Phycisphaerales bacterium]
MGRHGTESWRRRGAYGAAAIIAASLIVSLPACGRDADDEGAPAPTAPTDSAPEAVTPEPVTPQPAAPEPGAPQPSATPPGDEAPEPSARPVPEAAQDTMSQYLETFEGLLDEVGGIRSRMDAATRGAGVSSSVSHVRALWDELQGLSPEVRGRLASMFEGRIDELRTRFDGELSRLRANDSLSSIASLLEGLPLPTSW